MARVQRIGIAITNESKHSRRDHAT